MDRTGSFFCGALRLVLQFAVASLLVSCTQPHTLSRDELRSDLTAAISIAGETEMSIDFALRGQSTDAFSKAHFHYLAEQLQDSRREIADSMPAPELQQGVRSSQAQMDALSRVLAVAVNTKDAASLNHAKQRVGAIRKALEDENASL